MLNRVLSTAQRRLFVTLERLGVTRPAWKRRLGSEAQFWDAFLTTKGLQWPDDFAFRLDPESPMQPVVLEEIQPTPGSHIKILDVGAGPLTFLGKRIPGCTVKITATDALADDYDRLLLRHGVIPPVRTVRAEAEDLTANFGPSSFDFVFARNCLDHSYDPVKAIEEIISVLKPGKKALLMHKINEASVEHYKGLHQWNFNIDSSGRFIVSSKYRAIDMNAVLERVASVRTAVAGDWATVVLHKFSSHGENCQEIGNRV